MSGKMEAVELANFIIDLYPDKGITPMKLQKLAYYAKAWTLVAKKPFIKADFEKWTYGPVNYSIYSVYKKYGSTVIPPNKASCFLDNDKKELLKFILDNYVDYSAFTLSAMTHNEEPWQKTFDNNIIPDKVIYDYYAKQPFAKNFQDGTGHPFHVLKSNTWHSFTLDMDAEEAETFATYPSFQEFQQHSNKANHQFKELLQDVEDLF